MIKFYPMPSANTATAPPQRSRIDKKVGENHVLFLWGLPGGSRAAAPSHPGLLTGFSGGRGVVGFLIMEPFCHFPSFVFPLRMVYGALSAGGFHSKNLGPL